MGGIFGGGGRLLDISEDGKTTFADTWLGDLLGFDGSLGVNGPDLKESWGGARRTFEDAARGYVTSKLTQKKAEDQFDITGIDQYRPMLPQRETTPSSVPTDTEEAMKYGPSPWRKETIEQRKKEALVARRKDQEAEELLMSQPVEGPTKEEMITSYERLRATMVADMEAAEKSGNTKAAKLARAYIDNLDNDRPKDGFEYYWESYKDYVKWNRGRSALESFNTDVLGRTPDYYKGLNNIADTVVKLPGGSPRQREMLEKILRMGSIPQARTYLKNFDDSEEKTRLLDSLDYFQSTFEWGTSTMGPTGDY